MIGECRSDVSLERVDAVVVGGGLAGLTTARDLTARGLSAVVLEARSRVGGRILNHTFPNGVVVELGGQWVGPTQDRVLSLAAELGAELFPTFDSGDSLVSIEGQTRRFSDDSFGLPDEAREEVELTQKTLEEMALTVPLLDPWTAPEATRWDRQTVETWIEDNVRTPEARDFWRLLVAAVFAAESWDISLLHFLFYVHSGGLIDRLISTAGGAQESRIIGGSQILAKRLADRLGDAVRLSSPVGEIVQTADGAEVVAGGTTIRSRRVAVAIPPALAARIRYSPALSPLRDQLTQKMPMGYVIKCMAMYPEPFWREEGLSGFAVDLADPVGVIFDNSPPDAGYGVLLCFVEGRHGRILGELPAEGRKAVVIAALERFFGPRAADPIDYVDQNWAAEEWTRGCYGAHLAPGAWTQFGKALRRPCGMIHWAGTETSDVWNGYMEGAIRSGKRVAREIFDALA
jgi:monoamine oxidase